MLAIARRIKARNAGSAARWARAISLSGTAIAAGSICARSSLEVSSAAARSPSLRTRAMMSATIAGTSSACCCCARSISPPERSSAISSPTAASYPALPASINLNVPIGGGG
jgi:hypothetical protein